MESPFVIFSAAGKACSVSQKSHYVELGSRAEIEEFRLEPHPISKYRLAISTLGLAGEDGGTASPSAATRRQMDLAGRLLQTE